MNFSISRGWLIGILATVVVVIAFVVYNNQQEELQKQRIEKLEAERKYKEELEAKQAELDRQKAEKAKQAEIKNIVLQLNEEYDKLDMAKRKLNSVTGFKLLRTSSERNQEINNAQMHIDIIQAKINKLEGRLRQLNPDYGSDT